MDSALGKILQNAREEKNISLDKASKEIKIQKKFLESLEGGKYEKLPSCLYAKNFLKLYSSYLGLNVKKILLVFDREYDVFIKDNESHKNKDLHHLREIKSRDMVLVPLIVKRALIVFTGVLFVGYLFFKAREVILPPSLNILAPPDNLTTYERTIEIKGVTEPEAILTINGGNILVATDGSFLETIDLQSGLNLVKIEASMKHSRSNVIYRRIMFESDEVISKGLNY